MTSPPTASTLESSSATGLKAENVLYEKRDGIGYMTVNLPKVLNALNTPTWTDIRTAFEDARDDTAVHGVILTGADISELSHATALDAERASRFGQEVLDLIENLGKPVMAAVNGFALGGGGTQRSASGRRIGGFPSSSEPTRLALELNLIKRRAEYVYP